MLYMYMYALVIKKENQHSVSITPHVPTAAVGTYAHAHYIHFHFVSIEALFRMYGRGYVAL